MDLLSYSPADLVPFSREAWLGLLGRYNQEGLGWVATGVAAGAAMVMAAGALLRGPRRPSRRGPRLAPQPALALLGVCWLWIGWAFFHRSLGALLWAADWLAWGCAAQGIALLIAALLPPPGDWSVTRRRRSLGWGLVVVAVVGFPLLARATGQPWQGIGWFGSAPDPTAVATLGLLLILPLPRPLSRPLGWLLLPVPVIWCLLAAALGQVLGDPLWPVPLLCAVAGLLGWVSAHRGPLCGAHRPG